MEVFAAFDYLKMAEESEKRIEVLKAGLEKVKAIPVQGMTELQARKARILLLEEEIMEERCLLRALREKSKERSNL